MPFPTIGLIGHVRPAISYRNGAVSTTADLVVPASVMKGNLAVFIDHANGGIGAPSNATPSGFTLIGTYLNANVRINTFYKILDGTEGGTTLTGQYDPSNMDKRLLIFDPVFRSVAVGDPHHESSDGNIASQTTLASAGVPPLIVFGGAAHGLGLGTFSTESPAFAVALTNSVLRVHYTIYNGSPLDHTVDKNDEGANNSLFCFYLVPVFQ